MKDLILAILNIFKYVGKFFTFVRNFIFNALFLTAAVILLFIFIPKEVSHIPAQSILRLDIFGDIVEEKRVLGSVEKLFVDSVDPDAAESETVLQDILDIIDNAAGDDRIVALLLNLKHMDHAGLNQLQTIGQALVNFKKTGKTITAAEDYYSQSQYFLASYADKIFLNPMGGVDIHGFGVYRLYFREAMEKLAINYNIFKVGTYKSALEPFTRDNMSPEDRKQNETWLSALWQGYKDNIQQQRKISKETIENYTTNIGDVLQSTGGDTAQLALKTGLVDQLANRSDITAHFTALAKSADTKPSMVGSADYYNSILPSYSKIDWQGDKIGLIIAEGNILPGKQPAGLIGGDSLAALIKKAREDNQIKALVLRINSGGGSAFASEIIRQELLLLQKKGKPVVVSMGAVAASGGYWIAADADEIWASEATITGSIGIFGLLVQSLVVVQHPEIVVRSRVRRIDPPGERPQHVAVAMGGEGGHESGTRDEGRGTRHRHSTRRGAPAEGQFPRPSSRVPRPSPHASRTARRMACSDAKSGSSRKNPRRCSLRSCM